MLEEEEGWLQDFQLQDLKIHDLENPGHRPLDPKIWGGAGGRGLDKMERMKTPKGKPQTTRKQHAPKPQRVC